MRVLHLTVSFCKGVLVNVNRCCRCCGDHRDLKYRQEVSTKLFWKSKCLACVFHLVLIMKGKIMCIFVLQNLFMTSVQLEREDDEHTKKNPDNSPSCLLETGYERVSTSDIDVKRKKFA